MRKLLFQSPILKPRRQELRNNPTQAEKLLWQRLKGGKLGMKFIRQYSVGNYILDFYCPKKKLGIELDGDIHDFQIADDEYRTRTLNELGIKIYRFNNQEIENNLEKVVNSLI